MLVSTEAALVEGNDVTVPGAAVVTGTLGVVGATVLIVVSETPSFPQWSWR
jgi:hypothetical protein